MQFVKACREDNKSIVRFLVENSFISVTELYDNNQTLLHRAAACANAPIVSLILEFNKDVIDIQDTWGNTALYTAIKTYNNIPESSESILLMLSKRLLDLMDTQLDTALHTNPKLCRNIPKNHVIETVRVLIENGASIVIKNKAGDTPLHYATLFKAVELVSFISQLDDTVVNIVDKHGGTALHRLCRDYNEEFQEQIMDIARVLIKNGVSVIIKDKDGCTALHYATVKKVVELVSLISQVDTTIVNMVDNDGRTALHRLCMHYPDRSEERAIDTARVLIKNGASVVLRDQDDRTALHSAAS
ncbi:Ankyrin [Carabus blaptoides fortunei]